MTISLARRAVAEAVGTCLLVTAVIGSGIMAERLSGGNAALALLANTIATGAALVALIIAFGGISGAHFNPAVTLADALECRPHWRQAPPYVLAQAAGGMLGALVAHLMFALPLYSLAQKQRSGFAQIFSEYVATFGLLAVIWGSTRFRSSVTAFAVGAYITAAYWFTGSTSFANPAITLARAFTDTFTGLRPADVLPFVGAQLAGALSATLLFRWLAPALPQAAPDVVPPRASSTTPRP